VNRYGRLGDGEFLGGPGKAPLFGHGMEDPEVMKVHRLELPNL
jgi:hypothetical protein